MPKETFMRHTALRVAIALTTFAAGSSAAGVWHLISPSPAAGTARRDARPEWSLAIASSHGDEREILELYRQYEIAQTAHDAAFFERTEADSFILTYQSGGTLNRTQAIEALGRWPKDIKYTNDELNIQLHGDVAVVTGRMTARHGDGETGGATSQWQWVDLLKKRAGRWQILSTTQID
jgi:ketosteroid isomerase-like protein